MKATSKPATPLTVDKSIKSRSNDLLVQRKMEQGEQILRQANLIPVKSKKATT